MGAILKRWNGSAWEAKPLKYWNGSAWVTKPLKYWNGTVWVGGAVAYADTFNRADANLEASAVASGGWSWTWDGAVAGALAIDSNRLRTNTTDSIGSAYKTPDLGTAEHYVQYTVTQVNLGTSMFACCRLTDRQNYVGVRSGLVGSNGTVEVFRRVAGSFTNLYTSPGATVIVGDVVKLECSGSNFRVLKNGSEIKASTAIGAALNSTHTGAVGRTSITAHFDSFEAGTL